LTPMMMAIISRPKFTLALNSKLFQDINMS
jgi:hypothetical protein